MYKRGDMLVQVKYECIEESPFVIITRPLNNYSLCHVHLYTHQERSSSIGSFRPLIGKDMFHKDYENFLIMHNKFLKGYYIYEMYNM